jgi:hypothetical protein
MTTYSVVTYFESRSGAPLSAASVPAASVPGPKAQLSANSPDLVALTEFEA